MTGDYWLRLLSSEHSLRKHRRISFAHSSSYNQYANGLTFFHNFKKALLQCLPNIEAIDIWKLYEAELNLFWLSNPWLCDLCRKTMITAYNAGGFIPPMLILARVNEKDFMIHGAPEVT